MYRLEITTYMRTEDFDFYLPEELIAQHPLAQRDHSRLLVLDKHTGSIVHRRFDDVLEYLRPGDVLVVNNTRVIPARLFGVKKGGTAHVEVLLLKPVENRTDCWEVLVPRQTGEKRCAGRIRRWPHDWYYFGRDRQRPHHAVHL